ncbi:nitrous oxide-stimulated promoter family protein [Parendozoicomonas haliclonae]|uniref:nitrous oxide-stimulated promoter family protein n=1 Tax=Parendozoicomonas haliclonae TaxID=1960125 RepID=UPI0013FE46B8|nr:nitrous oxide-stimulated promoter family protein [Parendozoicomonas haliclonae]
MGRYTVVSTRAKREVLTVHKMLALYCHHFHQHKKQGLCPECHELLAFSERRTQRCIFGENKPVCEKCPTHCYKPSMRNRIRTVMRWAGPRMLLHHPILSIFHMLDKFRPVPDKPTKALRR